MPAGEDLGSQAGHGTVVLHLAAAQIDTVVADLRDFLMPVLVAIAAGGSHDYPWRAGTGWQKP